MNDSDEEIIAEIDLFIVKIICFENNLVHATFSDNTSIVIHPSFEYITYFHSDNTKNEMKSEFLIRKFSIDSKVNLLVSVFNLFANEICPYTSKYVKEYGLNCDIIKLLSPLCFIYWIDEDKFYTNNENEFYMITSQDSHTKLFLFKNLRVIKVEYLSPYDIITNEFIKICKFYTINNIDSIWITPLFLILNHFKLSITTNNSNLLNHNVLNERIVKNEYRTELPKNKHFTQSQNHLCNIDNIVINPLAFIYHKTLPVKFIYTRNFTYIVNSIDKEIDVINNEFPVMNIYTKGKCDILVYIDDIMNLSSMKQIHIDIYAKVISNKTNEKIDDAISNDIFAEITNEIVNIKNYGNIFPQSKQIDVSIEQSLRSSDCNEHKGTIDFVFEGDELFLFREVKGVGEFFSFKNESVKANFYDRTVVRMNKDMMYADILNSKGEKILLKTSDITGDNLYYKYVKMVVDFGDVCFNRERYRKEEEQRKLMNEYVKQKISQLEDTESVIFKKKKIFSDEYLYNKQPTQKDIEVLLKKNEEMLNEIRKIKEQNKKI